MQQINFEMPTRLKSIDALREEVREFLRVELANVPVQKRAGGMTARDPDFSRKLGAKGWIGMTWPKQYGGGERSALERYVVIEEMLSAGAPVGAHWTADRQSGPLLLRYGTEEQRQKLLPRITAGECYFCVGMSEPDSGSDLAAARTRAQRTDAGYVVNGTKIWTSNAHLSHYMILFCRTEAKTEERHAGMSQFLVDLKTPGITIRPIYDMSGHHHFNEVFFEDVLLPHDALLGTEGGAWKQVTDELTYERSGPERFLSSYRLLAEGVRACGKSPRDDQSRLIGKMAAQLVILRQMSRSVAGMLERGEDPALQAALVKDLGNSHEQEVVELVRLLTETEPSNESGHGFADVMADMMLRAPAFSIRGGTREILRGVIARGLGLR